MVDRLAAADLRAAFPEMRDWSRYMRAFAKAWPELVPQPVGQLPWGHVTVLLDKVGDHGVRDRFI